MSCVFSYKENDDDYQYDGAQSCNGEVFGSNFIGAYGIYVFTDAERLDTVFKIAIKQGAIPMNVSFYVSEWHADDSVGGDEYRDRFLYSKELDVLPVINTTLYHTITKFGNGTHKTKYRVIAVDWSVHEIDNDYISHEVQVIMIEVKN